MTIQLQIITPVATLIDITEASWVRARLADGAPISIWPHHAPLLAETVVGQLEYEDENGVAAVDVGAGILHVAHNMVTVLTLGEEVDYREIDSEDEQTFDRLADELLTTLHAPPAGALDEAG